MSSTTTTAGVSHGTASKALGALCWFSVKDKACITPAELEAEFRNQQIPMSYYPPALSDVNAFRRATGERVKQTYEAPWMGNGTRVKLFLREVQSTKEAIMRRIVREIHVNGKLQYDAEIGEAVFYRQANSTAGHSSMVITIHPDGLDQSELDLLSVFKQKIEDDYLQRRTTFRADTIRKIVREYTKDLGAIEIKPSVYFIKKTRLNDLDRIVNFTKTAGGDYHTMPLSDEAGSTQQAEMLNEAFQNDVEKQAAELQKLIAKANEAGSQIDSEEFDRIRELQQVLHESVEETNKALGLSAERAGMALRMIHAGVLDMGSRLQDEREHTGDVWRQALMHPDAAAGGEGR